MNSGPRFEVKVGILGCDDATYFNITVNQAELKFLQRLANQSKETSGYPCQPVIEVGDVA